MFSIADMMETLLFLELSLGVRICSVVFTMWSMGLAMFAAYSGSYFWICALVFMFEAISYSRAILCRSPSDLFPAVIMSNFFSFLPNGITITRIAMVSMVIVPLVSGLDMSYLQAVGVMVIHFVLRGYYHKGLKSLFGQLACSATTSFCANCWKGHPKSVSLKKCKCKCLEYCNAACQKEHWKRVHKDFCKEPTPFDPLDPLEAGDMMSIFCHLSFHFRIEGKLKGRAKSNKKAGFTNCEQKKRKEH